MIDVTTNPGASTTTRVGSEPAFQAPAFALPKFELPDGFREMTAQRVHQGAESFVRAFEAARMMTSAYGPSSVASAKGIGEYAAKISEMALTSTMAMFDLISNIVAAQSVHQMIEVSVASSRQQFDALAAQAQELSSLAQRVTLEAARPVAADFTKTFQAAGSS